MMELPLDFQLDFEPKFKFPRGMDYFDEETFYHFLEREFNIGFGE